MRLAVFALFSFLLPATAIAQTTYAVVPAELASEEGGRYNLTFAAYASQRVQLVEGELGSTARSIRGIGFRFDEVAAQYGVTGRRYSSVKIACSAGDHTAISATFTNNPVSTPTSVFSGAVSLPGQAGNNWTFPQPWLPSLNFAFQTTYQHAGTKDLLLDFEMTGGTLANNATWSGSRPRYYYLDSPYVNAQQVYGRLLRYGNGEFLAPGRKSTVGCKDSKISFPPSGPAAWLGLTRFQPTHSQPSFRNMTSFYGIASNVPSLTNIAFLYGVPNRAGVNFAGVGCNKVYVDLTVAPIVRFAQSGFSTAGARAFDYLLGSATGMIPSNSSWEGFTIMTQAAFNDSGNGQLRITQASTTTYPKLPPPSLRRVTVWQWDATSPSGRRSWIDQDFSVIRYTL